ncbi:DUF4231 domain-containing protein [Nocardia sp. NPDC004711]
MPPAGFSESSSTSDDFARLRMDAETYLSDRLERWVTYYAAKSLTMKRRYLGMQTLSVVGGLTVPALVNLHYPWIPPVVTVISLMVAACVTLENLFRFREQWRASRSAEQLLRDEKVSLLTRTGPYEEMDDQVAFRQLVTRAEAAIATEMRPP